MVGKDDKKEHETEEDDSTYNEISGLNPSVVDALKNLEGEQEVYEDEDIKKITSLCLKYLRDEREVPQRDFKMSIYLNFLDDPCKNTIREMLKKNEDLTERDMWEMIESALGIIEERTDLVEITKDGGDHIYKWKK